MRGGADVKPQPTRVTLRQIGSVGIPVVVGALELTHPTWTNGSVAEGVAAAEGWWLPLHVLLLVGYLALVWCLWPPGRLARLLLGAFAVCNSAFLVVDGIVAGLVGAQADALWTSPPVVAVQFATGATWCAALLALAAARVAPSRLTHVLFGVTWLSFVSSVVVPYAGLATALSLAATAFRGYTSGARVAFVLLLLAAIARQHVGLEGAVGLLCLALASGVEFVGRRCSA